MTNHTNTVNLRENINSIDTNRENLLILKGLDHNNFEKLIESFGSEKEKNKALLSGFLNSTNLSLSKLGGIKINIDHIKNFVHNKPDISKDLEKKIAKLYLQKLYESGATNIPFLTQIKDAFDITSKADIQNKNVDFKTIQVNIRKIGENFDDIIKNTTVSNDEIFDLLQNDINKYQNFQSQNISSQPMILDLLQFEVKAMMDYIKSRGKNVEKDMNKTIFPTSTITKLFDSVKDIDIERLMIQKGQLEGKDPKEIAAINEKIWLKYIENFEKMGVDTKFIHTLKTLIGNNFNFSKLDKKEQTILWQTLIVNDKDNSFAKYAGLDQNEYNNFLKDLYDFEKEKLSVNIEGDENLNLHIKRKIQQQDKPAFLDIENFKNMDEIQPIQFTVNIDANDPEIIKALEDKNTPLRKDGIMETYITKGGALSLGNGYKLEICGKMITKSQLDELLDCENDKEKLKAQLKKVGLFNELKATIDQTINTQNPLFEEILKNLDVKVVERNLIFDGKNVNKLSQLYIVSKLGRNQKDRDLEHKQDEKTKAILGNFDRNPEDFGGKEEGAELAQELIDLVGGLEEGEDADDIFNLAQQYYDRLNDEGKKAFKQILLDENNPFIDDIVDQLDDSLIGDTDKEKLDEAIGLTDDGEPKEEKIETQETPQEKFEKARKGLSGDKDCEFKEGTRLYLDLGGSQLPPKDVSDANKSYFSFEIVNIGATTFTLKAICGDLKSDLTGKEYVLQKTEEQLNALKKGGSVFKVRERTSNDWKFCLESVSKANFLSKFTAFGEMEGQVQLKGDKFVNAKGEEVKYFDRVESYFDDSNEDSKKRGQGQKLSKYEIKKIDTNKGTVKIASTFSGYDKKSKKVSYKYENELPFEQFILLMEGKKLKGYTQAEQEEMETKYKIDDPGRLAMKGQGVRWFSIGNFIDIFKNTSKAISDKIKKRNDDQREELENFLFSQEGLNLYGKLSPLLGDTAKKLQYEFYTNRENRTRKKIEERYKIFESDPNYTELYKEHLLPILSAPGYKGDSQDKFKFAAALLIMLKKEGPYPRDFAGDIGKGNWVEKLLGPEHKTRFLNFYEKKKSELEQEKDLGHKSGARLAMQEELNKMEMQYIICVIDGRAPYGPDSNEFMLKSVRGLKFMGQLEENFGGYFNKHEDEKNKMETFYAAEEQYLRTVGAGRFSKALPALERMCEKANTPGEVFRVKGYLLAAMLMGIIKNNSSSKTIKSFWATCRSMGFAPGYWMRDIEQQDKVKILLDGVTNGDFSKTTGFNISDFELGHLKDGKYSFVKTFEGYRNANGKNILKKIENPSYKNNDKDKSIMELARDKSDANSYVFKDIIKNSTTNDIDGMGNVDSIFAQESPLSATSNMVRYYIPQRGKYSRLKDPEDIGNAEDFRNAVGKEIPEGKQDKDTTKLFFQKFFNRFDEALDSSSEKMIIKSLPLIQKTSKLGSKTEARFMLWYMIKGLMHEKTRGSFPNDFETVMNKFVDFMFDNLDNIDDDVINSTFDDKELVNTFKKPYEMLNWEQFQSYYMNDMKSNMGGEKSRYNRLISLQLKKKGLSSDDIINYDIENIRKKIKEFSSPERIFSDFGNTGLPKVNVNISNEQLKALERAEQQSSEDSYYSFAA